MRLARTTPGSQVRSGPVVRRRMCSAAPAAAAAARLVSSDRRSTAGTCQYKCNRRRAVTRSLGVCILDLVQRVIRYAISAHLREYVRLCALRVRKIGCRGECASAMAETDAPNVPTITHTHRTLRPVAVFVERPEAGAAWRWASDASLGETAVGRVPRCACEAGEYNT